MTPPGPEPLGERQAVWSRHWGSGAPHSCAGSYGALYGGTIAAFWARVHADTPAGARLLDIATGSGAVPRLLLQLRPDLVCQIDAVDLARVEPAWLRQLPPEARARTHLHAGVRAEALPFPDGCFDLITSQFGLEYADAGPAVSELLRVRRAGGRVALVLHHAGSRPVVLAGVELAHLAWLAGPDGLLAAAAAMIGPMARAATEAGRTALAADRQADAARERFNAAQDALAKRALVPDGADVLGEVQDAVAQMLGLALQQGEAPARAAWQRLAQQLADSRLRLAELQACALDEAAAAALGRRLGGAGLRVQCAALNEGPHLMGWTLLAVPA